MEKLDLILNAVQDLVADIKEIQSDIKEIKNKVPEMDSKLNSIMFQTVQNLQEITSIKKEESR